MKIVKKLPIFIALILLIVVVNFTSANKVKTSTKPKVKATSNINNSFKEIKGLWVTYMDLDMENTDKSYNTFKSKFNTIANNAKKNKFNTLIVQVRPFSDALYKSEYFPYSHILTGIQGTNPNYDPLKYMCAYCHKLGLNIQAWINPYRVRINNVPDILSNNNPYAKDNSLGFKVGNDLYYNPANEEARQLIELGIEEIVKNYNVDGIQFDDYFYPTQSKSIDKTDYNSYVKSVGASKALSLANWRMANVNILIAECYTIIHKNKDNVIFGISPQGNIDNDYKLYADVKSWCSASGYIDYICPQLYYSLDNPALKFKDSLNNWCNLNYDSNVKLVIGLAGYKAGTDSDTGTWLKSNDILQKELKLVRKAKTSGVMLYSYSSLINKECKAEMSNFVKELD